MFQLMKSRGFWGLTNKIIKRKFNDSLKHIGEIIKKLGFDIIWY